MLQIPNSLEDCLKLYELNKQHINHPSKEGQFIRDIKTRLDEHANTVLQTAKQQNPLAFIKPSYEQALKLNAWIWGMLFYADFDGNRQGKTACSVFNALLYIFPNDPQWKMFQPYTDHLGRKVQVLRRPSIKKIYQIKSLFEKHPFPPSFNTKLQPYEETNREAFEFVMSQIEIPDFSPDPLSSETNTISKPTFSQQEHVMWVGAPDIQNSIKPIIMPEWRKWLPKSAIVEDSEYKARIKLSIPHNNTVTNWTIQFKTYETQDQKWSMGAVDAIVLTEGIQKDIWAEVKMRFKAEAFGSWDYTPYEAKNVGSKSALAYNIFRGKEPLPLRATIFSGFGIHVTPEHILPEVKRLDMIKNTVGKAEAAARIDGNFFTDSPQILSKLDRPFHALPISFSDLKILRPNLLLFRSTDPGYDHPTACAWMALSSANEWFVYRFYSKRATTIDQRCSDIITLSNNERRPLTPSTAAQALRVNSTLSASNQDKWPDRPLDTPLSASPIVKELQRNKFLTSPGWEYPPDIPRLPSISPPSETQRNSSTNNLFQEYHPHKDSEVYVATFLDYHAFKTDEETGRPIANHYRNSGLIVRESPTTRPKDRAIAVNNCLEPLHHLTHPITKKTPGARLYFLINEKGVGEALTKMEELYWARSAATGDPKDEMQENDDDEFDAASYPICSNYRWTRLDLPKIL